MVAPIVYSRVGGAAALCHFPAVGMEIVGVEFLAERKFVAQADDGELVGTVDGVTTNGVGVESIGAVGR